MSAMVIFHGTEWDTDCETHPNNRIPLIFKHPFDGLKRWRNFLTKPWFLRGVEHERGKGFISNNIEVSGGFKPPKAQFFALLLTEGKAGKGPG